MIKRSLRNSFVAMLAICFSVTASNAVNIDFSTEDDFVTPLGNGQIIDTEFGNVFTVSSSGSNAGPAIFDTTPGVNAVDPDLWVDLGNAMILQSNSGSDDATSDGLFFDTPNDDASQNNFLIFDFILPVQLISVDIIDVNGNGAVTVTMTDKNGNSREYFAPMHWTYDISEAGLPPTAKGYETLALDSLLPQMGEGGQSVAPPTDIGAFDINNVIQLEFEFDGSQGVDNLQYIPEPATALLAGFAGLALIRRRR